MRNPVLNKGKLESAPEVQSSTYSNLSMRKGRTSMAISTSAPEVEGVCANCTFDDYLSAEIKKTGTSLKCVGCEKKRKSILLSELAKKVEELIHKHYQRYSGGSELNSIVQDVASVEPE